MYLRYSLFLASITLVDLLEWVGGAPRRRAQASPTMYFCFFTNVLVPSGALFTSCLLFTVDGWGTAGKCERMHLLVAISPLMRGCFCVSCIRLTYVLFPCIDAFCAARQSKSRRRRASRSAY